jgi:hypothetical protein
MICALALLFPVISLSDDLHPEIAVVDSASGKRQCLVVAQDAHKHDSRTVPNTHLTAALLQCSLGPMEFSSEGFVLAARFQSSAFLTSPPIGRSPPPLQ